VKDERILLASPLFQAQIHDIGEFIEDFITTSGTDPGYGKKRRKDYIWASKSAC
jgi:hypothetical protein